MNPIITIGGKPFIGPYGEFFQTHVAAAPNGVELGLLTIVEAEDGARTVTLTQDSALSASITALKLVVYGSDESRSFSSQWEAPADVLAALHAGSGQITLGTEAEVFGPFAGRTISHMRFVPTNASGDGACDPVTFAQAPSVLSAIITGDDFTDSLKTATVETSGSGTVVETIQWILDGVDIPGATSSTYLPAASAADQRLSFRATATSEYPPAAALTSDELLLILADYAEPGVVAFTAATGSSPGEVDITIGATLPDAGDGDVVGDSDAVLDLLEYTLDGAEPITLTDTPTALAVITITTTPGWSGLLGVRAVSDFPREGEFIYVAATAAGETVQTTPEYTGGLEAFEFETGESKVWDWTDHWDNADEFTVNTGLTNGVSSGAGSKIYTVSSFVAGDVTMSVTALNTTSGRTDTRTFHVIAVTPGVAASWTAAIPAGLFVIPPGGALNYYVGALAAGTDNVFSSGEIASPFAITADGYVKTIASTASLVATYSAQIEVDNAYGPAATSSTFSVGIVATAPTALTAAAVNITESEYRYGSKWRTPRAFPTGLAPIALGPNPVSFAATNTTAVVALPAGEAAKLTIGQEFYFTGLSTVKGVALNSTVTVTGGWITAVSATITVEDIDGDNVTFIAPSAATSTGAGGGSAGVLQPTWAEVAWTGNTPDANGLVPDSAIETGFKMKPSGEMQIFMTDPLKNGDPDAQTPRLDFSVVGPDAVSTRRFAYRQIPGGPRSAWSPGVSVPLVVDPVTSSEWLPVSTRTKESYEADIAGNQGQQYQRCRTWNLGVIDPEKRGWIISAQDENTLRLTKNGNAGGNNDPVLWGQPRLDGYFGSKSGGLYLNTDDAAGAGLFAAVSGTFDGGGFGTTVAATGVYYGDGTLNWARKVAVTRPSGPGPYVSGSSGPKKAWTVGGSPAGNPEYFGNSFDRRGNFIARRPQVHERQNCTVFKPSKALLDADLAYAAGVKAWVYADATAANRAIYTKTGASGAGSWTKGTVALTDAQRPIYAVEQHGARKTNLTYQALFKSTDGGLSYTFVRELAIATFANGDRGIYFVLVAPNGYVLLVGGTGAFLSKDDGVTFTRVYTREVSAAHFYGGTSTTPSGIRLGDGTKSTLGGVYFAADSSVTPLTFAKTGTTGLASDYNVWDMECAPSNQSRILITTDDNAIPQNNQTAARLSTNGGSTWSVVTSTALPGPATERFRWGFGGDVAKGHSGFLFCPTNELKVAGWTNQTVSLSIDGGASFQGDRVAFFDGMHNKGTGTGPLTGTTPWKKILTVSQDSLAATWNDGTGWAQRSGLSTGDADFQADLAAAGAGNKPYVSGACGVYLPNSNVVCAANRDTAGQPNVMVVLTNRQSDGTYPLANATIRNLSQKTTRAVRSEWSISDPDGYAFLGRWGIGNVGAAAGSITFDDHDGHEFLGQFFDGSVPISYWAGAGGNPTAIYRSTHAKGLNGQATAWATIQATWCRNLCVDHHTPERVLYVRNSAGAVIREIKRVGGALTDTVLKDGSGADVDFATLIADDLALRIPGSPVTLPASSFANVSSLAASPHMPGLFYAVVGVHGIPNVWMSDPATGNWKNISDNLPRTLWYITIHPLTGDVLLDSSMGRHILPPPVGYPNVTYKGALSSQLKAFYDKSTVPNPPVW